MIYWSILSVFVQNRRCIIFIEFELSVIEFSKSHLFSTGYPVKKLVYYTAWDLDCQLEIWISLFRVVFQVFVGALTCLPLGECSTIQPHIPSLCKPIFLKKFHFYLRLLYLSCFFGLFFLILFILNYIFLFVSYLFFVLIFFFCWFFYFSSLQKKSLNFYF